MIFVSFFSRKSVFYKFVHFKKMLTLELILLKIDGQGFSTW